MWPFKNNKELRRYGDGVVTKEHQYYCPQCGKPINVPIYCDECKTKQLESVSDLDKQIIEDANLIKDISTGPPCPLEIALRNVCVCTKCKHNGTCPMELKCRESGCASYIGGCTIYSCEGDKDAEDKRKVFKDGAVFDPVCFRFAGSSKQPKENI
jgi:hypothetical protein